MGAPSLPDALGMLEELRILLLERYSSRFRGLVLYGSYARGDQDEESDVDLLVLVDDDTDVDQERDTILRFAHKLNLGTPVRGLIASPVLVRESEYQRGKTPFFLNVKREGISLAPEDAISMQREIHDLLARAGRNLRVARTLLQGEDHDVAASRAYYAMFYAAEAALLSRGIARSRHSGVISAFNELLVHPGTLPAPLASSLTRAFELRNRADYGSQSFPKEEAQALLGDAEEFVGAVSVLLSEQEA